MKKEMFAVFCILFFAFGCRKDDIEINTIPTNPFSAKTMEVQIMFSSEPDTTITSVLFDIEEVGNVYIPAGGWMSGYSSITGDVCTSNCHFSFTDFVLYRTKNQIKCAYEGVIKSQTENNSFSYKGDIVIEISNSKFNGTLNINGGTGNLEGISGSIPISGSINFETGRCNWSGGGEIKINSSI